MARRDLFVGLVAGLVAGVLIGATFSDNGTQRAMAQAAPGPSAPAPGREQVAPALGREPAAAASTPGRYQVSAWAYATPGGGGTSGAYVLDTRTGQLWRTRSGLPGLEKVGKAE